MAIFLLKKKGYSSEKPQGVKLFKPEWVSGFLFNDEVGAPFDIAGGIAGVSATADTSWTQLDGAMTATGSATNVVSAKSPSTVTLNTVVVDFILSEKDVVAAEAAVIVLGSYLRAGSSTGYATDETLCVLDASTGRRYIKDDILQGRNKLVFWHDGSNYQFALNGKIPVAYDGTEGGVSSPISAQLETAGRLYSASPRFNFLMVAASEQHITEQRAIELSIDPCQILEPRKTYFDIGLVGDEITIAEKVTFESGGAVTSIDLDFSAAVSGQSLLAFISKDDDVATTGPAGWTLVQGFESNNNLYVEVWKREADGTEGITSWVSDSEESVAAGYLIDNADYATIGAGVTTSIGTDAVPISPTVTPLTDSAVVFAGFGVDGDSTPLVLDSGLVESVNLQSTTGAGSAGMAIGFLRQATAAATGTFTHSMASADEWAGFTVWIEKAVSDAVAPVLSTPTGTKTGSTTADGTVSTDEGNGTLYYLASTNATETAATIKAGSSQAVTATGSQAVSFSGLTASTVYYAHYVQDDAASNESNVQSSASFTTDAAASGIAIFRRRIEGMNHAFR